MRPSLHKVVIIGGGISGLSTAFFLQQEAARRGEQFHCTVVEASGHWGGKILTNQVDGLLIEGGPDSFLTSKPWALDLCRKLVLEPQLINTNETQSKTFTFSRGRLREFPQGLIAFVPTRLGPLFQSGLVSWPGIIRMGRDWFLRPSPSSGEDESLSSFFTRHFGQEAFNRLIEPLVAGIYAGDAEELSVRATFPRFVELERIHGSLIKGMLAQQKKRSDSSPTPSPPRTLFTTLRGGLKDLVEALKDHVLRKGASLIDRTKVEQIKRVPDGEVSKDEKYLIRLQDHAELVTDAVVLATPAYESARLLQFLNPTVSQILQGIPYASTATISLSYPKPEVEKVLEGFGFVVPRIEQKQLIAATWTSMKWSGRARADQSLIRCYLGGRGREQIFTQSDEELIRRVRQDLQDIVGITSIPTYVEVHRWERGMPQYLVGHVDRIRDIRKNLAETPNIFLTGAAYQGIGIPDCIRDANLTASKLSQVWWSSHALTGERMK